MKLKGVKSIRTRRNNFVLLFVIFFCPQLLAEASKEIPIDSLLGKDFTIADLVGNSEDEDSGTARPVVRREAPSEPDRVPSINNESFASDDVFSIFAPAAIVPRSGSKPVPQVLVVEQKKPKKKKELILAKPEPIDEPKSVAKLETKPGKLDKKPKFTAYHGFPNDPSSPLAKLIGGGLSETIVEENKNPSSKPSNKVKIDSKLDPIQEPALVAVPAMVQSGLKSITVTLDADRAKINTEKVTVAAGQSIPFSIHKTNVNLSTANVFVRDRSVVDWNEKEGLLTAHKAGLTEIYIYYANQLAILPVQVGAKAETVLDMPKSLAVLDNVAQAGRDFLASFMDEPKVSSPEQSLIKSETKVDQLIASEADPEEEENKNSKAPPKISENPSFDFIEKVEASPSQQKFDIKIVDERTDEEDHRVYPVAGVEVKLVGTSTMGTSDSLGVVGDIQIPKKSRFIVAVKDPYQRYEDTTVELSSDMVDEHNVATIRVLQKVTFDAYARIINNEHPTVGNSSICAKVLDLKGQPLTGVSVTLDPGNGVRPYFFNRYGIFDPTMDKTGPDGRFCYFNLEPGPFAFFFKTANGQQEAPAPMTLFASSHLEHNFKVGDIEEVNSVLAVSPTAFERWNGQMSHKAFRSIDYATLNPLGSEDEWQQARDSMTMVAKQTFYDGRSYYLAKNAEFEDTLYRIDSKNSDVGLVTPLIPRGFLENISNYSNIIRDLDKGTIFIEHGKFAENEDADNVLEVSLLDQNGNAVGEKVPLNGLSSGTLFFNVPTGTYTVVVKSIDGVGLDFDTVLVYSDTLSYLRTGSQLQRIDTNQDQLAEGSTAH